MQTKHVYRTTSEPHLRLLLWNQFKPFSKIFYWLFQGGTSFVDLLCYFVRVCLSILCGHLLGKGWPLGSRLWCLIVKLSLSHWYPGSGVVLDCIDSWYLPSFLFVLVMLSPPVHCYLVVPCWERADLLALIVMSNCVLSLSHVVSWVRCALDCIDSWSLSSFLFL